MADPQQSGEGAQGAVFSIDKIYLKDLSLENPGSPQSFLTQEQPQVEVGLRTRGEQVQPDVYECVLTVTLTAKVGRQDALPGRSRAGRALHDPRRAGRAPAARDRDQLPDGPLPLRPRNSGRRRDARGLSADPPGADQLRGALPAAAGPGAAAGDRRQLNSRGQLRAALLRSRCAGARFGGRRASCSRRSLVRAAAMALGSSRGASGIGRGLPFHG